MDERRICLVGVGGGGVKIAGRLAGLSSSGPCTAVINTDTRSLADSTVPRKIQIGQTRTGGLGAGGDTEIGRLCVLDDIDAIRPLFDEAELAIVIVALGGGTGSGGAPVLLEAARAAGCMTLCVATLPFAFEGPDRRERAEQAVKVLRTAADAVIAVSNDRLFDSGDQPSVTEAFTRADHVLSQGIRAIWRLLTHAGYIHLDGADLTAFVKACGGLCALAYGNGRGPDKALQAIHELLQSPLTGQSDLLRNARAVLVSIVGGPDLTLKEVGDMMQALTAQLPAACHVAMGTVVDDALRNKIRVTVLFADRWESESSAARNVPTKKPVKRSRSAAAAGSSAKKGKQTSLSFEAAARGRFKGVEPTILDGEDFDIPTFQRRGITIEKE